MIFQTADGAILEVYWRERGSEPWSQVTAHRFLARYITDRTRLHGLRWLLADRHDTGRIWRLRDEAILERAARLVSTGALLVAEYGWEERWPGSGFILGSSWDSAILFWRDQLHVERDLFFVREWINDMLGVIERTSEAKKKKQAPSQQDADTLQENAPHVESFRKLIASAPGMPDFGVLTDEEVLRLARAYFNDGQLLPIYHVYPGSADPGPGPGPDDPDDPKPPKPGPGPDDPDDPDNPPDDPICLLNASKSGSPFVTYKP